MNNESGISLGTHTTFAIVIKAGICTVIENIVAWKCFHRVNQRGYAENEASVSEAVIKSFTLIYTIINTK